MAFRGTSIKKISAFRGLLIATAANREQENVSVLSEQKEIKSKNCMKLS